MQKHSHGLLLTFAGVVTLGPDSLLIRLVEASPWTIIFWRAFGTCIGMLLLTRILDKKPLQYQYRRIGKAGLIIAMCFATSLFCFVNAIEHTSIANALIIIAASPIIAAILSKLILNETISLAGMVAIAFVITGVALVTRDSEGIGHLSGDIFALGTSFMIAMIFVLSRKYRDINMLPAMSLSGVLAMAVVLPFATPFNVETQAGLTLLLLSTLNTIGFALLIVGARYIPAYEVSLMMPLETIIAIILAWLILGEKITAMTFTGGVVVIVGIAINAFFSTRNNTHS